MKILFLGTAADQIPSPYCDCPRCTYAREHRGRDLRNRCSYLVNDDLLIDMGPDLPAACSMYGVHLMNLNYALITHRHRDHFDVASLVGRKGGFPNRKGDIPELTFVAPPSVMTLLTNSGVKDQSLGLNRRPILPYDDIHLPPYQVKAIKATHDPAVGDAVNYLINDGRSKVLIAHDTAVYQEEVWPHIKDIELDQLIIDCSVGTNVNFKAGQTRHLSVKGIEQMIDKMKEIGAITTKTSVIATHFTHQHCLPHKEMSAVLEEINVGCAYDGLLIDV